MINVYICTYNPNKEYLKRTVDAILNQQIDSALWDLTIIDNNSSSSVAEIDFIKQQKVHVLFEPRPGLSFARECAVKSAKGEVLVFVDDDNILAPDYLFWVNNAFTNNNIGILSGSVSPEYVVSPSDWFLPYEGVLAIRRISGDEMILNESTVCNSLFPIGAGMAIRKELIEDYYISHITYDNVIKGRKGKELSSGEDTDLDFYALYKGYMIGFFPKMKVVHIIPANRLELNYLTKLVSSILKSSFEVNKKWAPIFKHNVFEEFNYTLSKITFKLVVNKIGGVFSKTRYLNAQYFATLYRLKTSK